MHVHTMFGRVDTRTEIEGGEWNKSAVAKNLERQSILAAMLYRDLSL